MCFAICIIINYLLLMKSLKKDCDRILYPETYGCFYEELAVDRGGITSW